MGIQGLACGTFKAFGMRFKQPFLEIVCGTIICIVMDMSIGNLITAAAFVLLFTIFAFVIVKAILRKKPAKAAQTHKPHSPAGNGYDRAEQINNGGLSAMEGRGDR